MPVPAPRVVTLPSPYLFSRVAVSGRRPNDLMLDLARKVIRPVAERLARRGITLIHLQEPWIAVHGIRADDLEAFGQSISVITDDLPATTVLHDYFADGAPAVAFVSSASDLEYLPEQVARQKVGVLGQATRILRESQRCPTA